jgi:sister chromatid cohesion protein DCC1
VSFSPVSTRQHRTDSTPPRLSIKSLPPSASNTPNAKPAYAVLCTPNKSYQLRQVQTSNTLYVTQSTIEAHENNTPAPSTRAIASCPATLELHAADGDAVTCLEGVLPIYDMIDGEVDAEENRKTKASIFSDIPLSDGECEKAWDDLVAFELAGSAYRPSAKTLAQVWASISAAALAEGVKLDAQFLSEDMAKLVAEEGYPISLAASLIHHLSSADQDRKGGWSCLDPKKTVSFVGKTLLDAKQGSTAYLTADFLDSWRDSLPETWRHDAELKAIEGVYELPSSTTIRAKSKGTTATKAEIAVPKASTSRKWHEKFAKTRKK